MTTLDVQQRVLLNGKTIPLDRFTWNESTNTFSSKEDKLVVNFENIRDCTFTTGWDCTFKTGWGCTFTTGSDCTFTTGSDCTFTTGWGCTFKTGSNCTFTTGSDCTFTTGWGCTFKTGSNCTFTTGSDCTFTTGWGCTFKTGWDCTFKTGSDCTFTTGWGCTFKTGEQCVIMRNDIFQIIQPMKDEVIKLCPEHIEGYISQRTGEDAFYMNINGERIEHVIADNILSRVIRKNRIKGGEVLHVINNGEKNISFLVSDGVNWSHGDTMKSAKDSLMYKISDRDTSAYTHMTTETILTLEEGIKAYRVIAGACETQTKAFVENLPKRKKKYSIGEIAKITDGQYNSQIFRQFFKL